MTAPVVDLVIAVHTVERPIRRAVESVLASSDPGTVRVTVVCHDLDPSEIKPMLSGLRIEDLRLMAHRDGIRSPAGPMNAGLAAAEAEFVAVMGSDDHLEPDALREYMAAARSGGADVILMPLRHQGGELLRNPLVRWRRRRHLEVVADRLLYRSSPLALIRRSVISGLSEPFTEGLPAGVDLSLSCWLWTRPVRIDFPVSAPAYVISDDARDRVTYAVRPATTVMEPLRRLLVEDWVRALTPQQREALAIKTLRVHVLSAVRSRPAPSDWGVGDLSAVRSIIVQCLELAPSALDPFSVSDRVVLEAVRSTGGDSARPVVEALSRSSRAGRRDRLLPRRLSHSLHREATLTRFLLYRMDRWNR